MRYRPTALPLLACLVLATGLAACNRGQPTTAAICPDSAIIHGLDRLQREDAGHEVSASLENIDGVCTHSGDRLVVDMTIDVIAEAPRGTTIPYFVVITDPAGEVLDKVSFTTAVPADAPDGPVRLREHLHQEISGVAAANSAAFTILFGLDLPPDIALQQRRAL